ncbi:hypothetical protein GOODEAATRI_009513 [Goodea atripinnis]|uniref:Uncharacterized protein n=1 Tax=Goodea atripinnis TaxID=208336 RepID=A0ABV0PWN6_9TELE
MMVGGWAGRLQMGVLTIVKEALRCFCEEFSSMVPHHHCPRISEPPYAPRCNHTVFPSLLTVLQSLECSANGHNLEFMKKYQPKPAYSVLVNRNPNTETD